MTYVWKKSHDKFKKSHDRFKKSHDRFKYSVNAMAVHHDCVTD